MRNSSTPVRLSAELTSAARTAAGTMSRSIAEQIAHWARIGLELERDKGVALEEIRAVLDGSAAYDRLSAKEQAVVRAAWRERMDGLRAALRLDRVLPRWAELDGKGRVVVRKRARRG